MNDTSSPIKVSSEALTPEEPRVPHTREAAIELLQAVGWDPSQLSPEETAAIRLLYRLDSDQPIAELVKGDSKP